MTNAELRWEPAAYQRATVAQIADAPHGRYYCKRLGRRRYGLYLNGSLIGVASSMDAIKREAERDMFRRA